MTTENIRKYIKTGRWQIEPAKWLFSQFVQPAFWRHWHWFAQWLSKPWLSNSRFCNARVSPDMEKVSIFPWTHFVNNWNFRKCFSKNFYRQVIILWKSSFIGSKYAKSLIFEKIHSQTKDISKYFDFSGQSKFVV